MRTEIRLALRWSLVVLALSAFALVPAAADGKGGKEGGDREEGRGSEAKGKEGKRKEEELKAEDHARKAAQFIQDEKSQFLKFHKCAGSMMDKLLCLARKLADRRAQFAKDHADLISEARGASGADKAALIARVRELWQIEVVAADDKVTAECRRDGPGEAFEVEKRTEEKRTSEEKRTEEHRGGKMDIGVGVDGRGPKPPTK